MIKKIMKIFYKIIKSFLVFGVCLFILTVCLQRFSNNNIAFFDYRLLSVVTGSMAPKYNVGDVILCKKVDINSLKIGDDITYRGEYSSYKDRIVTHRIIKIEEDNSGKKLFYTKGLAAVSQDPVVHEEQIYGKIVRKMKILSFFYKFISKPVGFYICIFLPIAAIIGSEILITMLEKFEDKKRG